MPRSRTLAGAALLVALFLLPASAQAVQINGDPLVVASDEFGKIGVAYVGAPTSEFYGSSVAEDGTVSTAGSSGFDLTILYPDGSSGRIGARNGGLNLASPPVVTGTGTASDPFRLTTLWNAQDGQGSDFEVKQELVYENGAQQFRAIYNVRNSGQANLVFRASTGADLYGGGSDSGRGLLEPGPPRFVGGFNTGVGSVAGLTEQTPWSHFEEGRFSDVLSRAVGDPRTGDNLLDTVEPEEVDNGVAVQWDEHVGAPLAPGQAATFEAGWRFRRTFALTPQELDLTTGDTAAFAVDLNNSAGEPRAGTTIRWSTSGTNSESGTARTDAKGHATFEYVGANPGFDTVSVYADFNDNGVRDGDEPSRDARVTWTGLQAPPFGQAVNLKPVSGTVRVKLPRNAKVHGKWARAAQSGFVPLNSAIQVAVGAQLDTTRGRVQLTSSQPTGRVQSAQFYSGRFQVIQSRREKGLTEAKLTGPLTCPKGSGKAVSAASRSRRLWGRGKGRFRTRGRRSSATVRGTRWLTTDTCATTTTTVKDGVVIVKDFAKRKNVRVKAGKRYVARARRR